MGARRKSCVRSQFWSLVCPDRIAGALQYEKPSHMTWQEYAVFLLESIGLYSKKLQDHYYRKITILIDHYREKHGIEVEDIPDVTKRKEWLKRSTLA